MAGRRNSKVTVTHADGTQEVRGVKSFRPEGKRRCSRCGTWVKSPKHPQREWFCKPCLKDVQLDAAWAGRSRPKKGRRGRR